MNETQKTRWRRWLWFVAILLLVPIGVTASWLGTEYMLQETSGDEFCATCHTMEAVTRSYLESTHGGQNRLGFKAKCASCHLPHDSLLNYFVSKARTGIRDSWNQLTMNHDRIDWEAMRGRRAEFVYDSGCLHCHKEFKNGKGPEHPAYFAGGTNPFNREEIMRCVTCHYSVGHKDLAKWISKQGK